MTKRIISPVITGVALLSLTACAIDKTRETTLPPLPTTGITVVETLPITDVTYTPDEFAFFDDVAYFLGATPEMEDSAMLEFGVMWCVLMEDGMKDADVVERINEGASDESDRSHHFAIVLAGIRDICPTEESKAEYIALNSPLP